MTSTTIAALAVFFAGAALTFAFACRVRLLTLGEHRPEVWGMNVTGAIMCGWHALQACQGKVEGSSIATLAFAGFWIWISYPGWKAGPPPHTERGELQDERTPPAWLR